MAAVVVVVVVVETEIPARLREPTRQPSRALPGQLQKPLSQQARQEQSAPSTSKTGAGTSRANRTRKSNSFVKVAGETLAGACLRR